MLQQTQVDRVLPKYHEWLGKYPSFEALAEAPETEVDQSVVSPRLQHPAEASASHCARSGRELRREVAVRRSDSALVQGNWCVYGRGDSQFRISRTGGDSRYQRRARAVSRVCRPRRPQSSRHEKAIVEYLGSAGTAAPCLRFQPGPDGLRRHFMHGAKAEVSDMPDGIALRGVST